MYYFYDILKLFCFTSKIQTFIHNYLSKDQHWYRILKYILGKSIFIMFEKGKENTVFLWKIYSFILFTFPKVKYFQVVAIF